MTPATRVIITLDAAGEALRVGYEPHDLVATRAIAVRQVNHLMDCANALAAVLILSGSNDLPELVKLIEANKDLRGYLYALASAERGLPFPNAEQAHAMIFPQRPRWTGAQ